MANSEDDDGCTIPARPPIEALAEYTLDQDKYLADDIISYVEGQARDEVVNHAEFIKEEFALGERFEIWDVTTDKRRWWVVTNLTNLYTHEHFPSMDYLLSFHIGLMARLKERDSAPASKKEIQFGELTRRQNEIHEAYDRAVEAVDYQKIGLQLREAMLSLVTSLSEYVPLREGVEAPKKANFKEWVTELSASLIPGASSKPVRKNVRETAIQGWDLANWLTHARNADEMSALIAMQSLDMMVGNFLFCLFRYEAEEAESCPICSSRNIRSHFDINLGEDGEYFSSCGVCGWDDRPDN